MKAGRRSRFIVGVDLGTTNTAVAYLDASTIDAAAEPMVHPLPIPQTIQPGEARAEPLLPSFLYAPADGEFSLAQQTLPWRSEADAAAAASSFLVGLFAREHGAASPARLVSSAKSWLCHPGVDRRGAILPWEGPDDVAKISPLEASTLLLRHVRDAWNHHWASESTADGSTKLEDQDVVLTVPASFDAVARELTMEAARAAGLTSVTLFEEPQAAFYAWIHASGADWRHQVGKGDVALVVDVGGGTTDFTLIGFGEEDGRLTLDRLAVGDHLLLGGDNMDLALAHAVAAELLKNGTKLDGGQMLQLWHASRRAKEQLFADPAAETKPIALLGRGRKVIGGTVKTELQRSMVQSVLVDGFHPRCSLDDEPTSSRGGGLQELGLPYAADPAVTKHLAAFLSRNARVIADYRSAAGGSATPTAVLFNGGVFQAAILRERVLDVLTDWRGAEGRPTELPTLGLDRAVAVGAAYYGLVRRGRGVRIRGGVARSYYVGVES
ncbi:MAG: Hsp70 family protein, partial [Planctomycetia bacterium]